VLAREPRTAKGKREKKGRRKERMIMSCTVPE